PSLGRITEQTAGTDFPADRFFDIFVDVTTSLGVLHNHHPLHKPAVMNALPPLLTDYRAADFSPVGLYNSSGQEVEFIKHAVHVPLEGGSQFVVFRNRVYQCNGAYQYLIPEGPNDPPSGGIVTTGQKFTLDLMVNTGGFTITAQQSYL